MARDFELTYDGPALATGRMPVRDLAPALLALGDLFHEAHAISAPTEAPVELEVRAAPRRGSFEVSLHLTTSDVVNLLTSSEAVAAGTVVTLVGGVVEPFKLIKWILARQAVSREDDRSAGTTTYIDQSTNISIVVPFLSAELFERPTVRRRARDVVTPLDAPGVEIMKIDTNLGESVEVRESETQAFAAAAENVEPVVDQEFEAVVSVISPSFKPKYRWRVALGDQVIMAKIGAEDFIARIQRHEVAFLEGDALSVPWLRSDR